MHGKFTLAHHNNIQFSIFETIIIAVNRKITILSHGENLRNATGGVVYMIISDSTVASRIQSAAALA